MDKQNTDILKTLISMAERGTLVGCFADIPIDVYHHAACPGISSTTVKAIIKNSYSHMSTAKISSTGALEFGSAFHCFVNEPEEFIRQYQIMQGTKEERLELGKIPLDMDDFSTIKEMQKKVFLHPDAGPLLTEAQFELTYFSVDSETGVLKKCRVDAIKNKIISDLKSCESASSDEFARNARKFLYRVSGAYYLEVVSEVIGEHLNQFNLIACEKKKPHEINVFRVSDASLQKANLEIRSALAVIRDVHELGDRAWAGYELGIKDLYI